MPSMEYIEGYMAFKAWREDSNADANELDELELFLMECEV